MPPSLARAKHPSNACATLADGGGFTKDSLPQPYILPRKDNSGRTHTAEPRPRPRPRRSGQGGGPLTGNSMSARPHRSCAAPPVPFLAPCTPTPQAMLPTLQRAPLGQLLLMTLF